VIRKRSCVVWRGAIGKVPAMVTRWSPTLPHAQFWRRGRQGDLSLDSHGIHSAGSVERPCPDHAPVIEDWVPVGGAYYHGELVRDTLSYLSREDRLHLVETHPLFMGRCPQCGSTFKKTPLNLLGLPQPILQLVR
jgi:hypothetical protein